MRKVESLLNLTRERLRPGRASRQAVQEFSRSLALIVDGDALAASVAARIGEIFHPDRLIILRPRPSADRFVPTFSSGFRSGQPAGVSFDRRGSLARWLRVNECVLRLDGRRDAGDYLEPGEEELVRRLGISVFAPLIATNRLNGMLVLGDDDPGWDLSDRQAELLDLLANQAGLAFENADLYREQRERLDRMYRAERLAAVGQLAAAVAHEIRNPLTAIRSTMQYLLRDFEPDERNRELVQGLMSEVDRINKTISGLLDLSRPAELLQVDTDLRDPVEQALSLITAHADKQGVRLVRDLGSEPLVVHADVDRLKEVFLNLLLNAVQAMPGGGTITVSAGPLRRLPDLDRRLWAEVRVADDGPGIPAADLDRVLGAFFTTKEEGTGLGLATCQGIVERHSGQMLLESAVGAGTAVTVRLPRVE